jgi:hypothetical protein
VFLLTDFLTAEVRKTFPITFSYVRRSKFANIIEIKMGLISEVVIRNRLLYY